MRARAVREQIAKGAYTVGPGSLFPALLQPVQRGWLAASEGVSEKRRKAKYYRLTAAGNAHPGIPPKPLDRARTEFAPIPSARVSTAMGVKLGAFRRGRAAAGRAEASMRMSV